QRVADCMTSLLRAVRATRLYPPESPARKHHVESAYVELEELVRTEGTITLTIRDGVISHRGTPVYNGPDRDPFTHPLYSSAIFELAFDPGLTATELALFLDALGSDEAQHRVPGESLVTVLWRL